MSEEPGADFRPLIRALEVASADPYATLAEQLISLEVSFAAAEINPNPIPAVEISYALKVLQGLNANLNQSTRGTADLAPFFDPQLGSI
jgi:hypothetical protein